MSADDRLLTQQGERDSLNAFLDWYRAVAANKIRGLSDEDAKRVMTPTGLCPLGVVAHLAWAERLWFRWRFAGEELDGVEHSGDNSPTFQVAPSDTVASVIATYEDEPGGPGRSLPRRLRSTSSPCVRAPTTGS